MNVNKSIAQLHSEIETALREALKTPWANEVRDTVTTGEDGFANSLSDIVAEKRKLEENGSVGMQTIPPDVKVKIEKMFNKFPLQYRILGLYHAGGFTRTEIAKEMELNRQNTGQSLARAVERLRKYLTPAEYDSIRWALGDFKPIPVPQDRTKVHAKVAEYWKVRKALDEGVAYEPVIEHEFENDKPPSYYTPYQRKSIGGVKS